MQLPDRKYLDQHPLFTRLSGQVIWLLFEEHDADQETIGAFMDQLMPMLTDQIEVLKNLQAHPDGWLRIVITGSGPGLACPGCAERGGMYVSACDPRLMDFLPPYSLGCRTLGEFVSAEEFAGLKAPRILPKDASTPARHLHCPSEWLFSHDWVGTNAGDTREGGADEAASDEGGADRGYME